MSSIFPLEIEETILDLLAEDDKGNISLEASSLIRTTDTWDLLCVLPLLHLKAFSAKHLKSQITFTIWIAAFEFRNEDLTNPSIQESLKRISKVEFLTVRCDASVQPTLDWSNSPLRPALLHLLHLPTLTHFTVINIKDFVASDLISCVNLNFA